MSHDHISNQAVMFADVSGSSALYKQLGNVDAKEMIDEALAFMRKYTLQNHGTVVKTIGDELMARFDTPEDACHSAMAIQRHCQGHSHDIASLSVRIGMDYGHTLLDGDDVFGDTVNDAAYVANIARAQQIVVTEALVEALPCALKDQCEVFDRVNIKGESNKSLIFRLLWEHPSDNQSATAVMQLNHDTQQIEGEHVQLLYNQQRYAITADTVPFVIGRDHRRADLHVDSALASRDHCHILLRRGKFVLSDHSTNGTYIKVSGESEIYLRRETAPLLREGSILIGKKESSMLRIDYINNSF